MNETSTFISFSTDFSRMYNRELLGKKCIVLMKLRLSFL